MSAAVPPIIVAGHVCLDVIPVFEHREREAPPVFRPGCLVNVGPAVTSTGGAVANTGIALHRLGVPVRLLGKIGDDLFGHELLRLIQAHGPGLADGLICSPGEVTSYSLVISPPGSDRIFFHCPGANNTFSSDDVDVSRFPDANLFHFGYPPVMRRMFLHDGHELERLFRQARRAGLTVSLDLCMVDPQSEAGRLDWRQILQRVLPHVDLFCPSIDELLFMLDRPRYEQAVRDGRFDHAHAVDEGLLRRLSAACLRMGVAMVALKLGDQGLFLRATPDRARLSAMGRGGPRNLDAWRNRELHAPCFEVDVVGTTGAGDCTIAGLLAALTRGEGPEQVLQSAVAVGAASVEAADANSGVPNWSQLAARIANGWPTSPTHIRNTSQGH